MEKNTIANSGVTSYQINRFVSKKRNRMWLYNLSNEFSPIIFLHISHKTFQ